MLGGATAGVLLSSLDIVGDIKVRAELVAEIDARALVAIDAAGNAFGLTLAFNTIGWEPTNVFFALIEALIGDPAIGENTSFGAERPADATAVIVGSGVSAGGALSVSAEAAASITAYLSNEATSFPAALFGPVGMSINGGVASNRVSSGATSKIDGAAVPTYTSSDRPSRLRTGDLVRAANGNLYLWTGGSRGPPDDNERPPSTRPPSTSPSKTSPPPDGCSSTASSPNPSPQTP